MALNLLGDALDDFSLRPLLGRARAALNAHAATRKKKKYPLDMCVAIRYSVPMKVESAVRPPLPGRDVRARLGRCKAPLPR